MRGSRRTHRVPAVALAALALAAVGPSLVPVSANGESGEDCPNAALRTGASAHLPDCRAYELVSPAEKGGEDAFGEGEFAQAAASGDGIAYTSNNVFAGSAGAGVDTAYLESREGAGWLTEPLTPRVLAPLPADSLSYNFSEEGSQASGEQTSGELSQTVVRVPSEALTPEAPEGVYNLFARNAEGDYTLITAASPSVPIPAGCDTCYLEHDVPAFVGASSDLTHVIFEANESLRTTPSYPPDPERIEDLYESNLDEPAGQRVHPVGILPDGTLASGAQPGAGAGNINAEEIGHIDHAVSADGAQILFTAEADEGGPDAEQQGLRELYDRIGGPARRTIEVSAPVAGAEASDCKAPHKNCKPEPAQFWDAAEDGSVVLFTSKAELTKTSNTGPAVEGEENVGNDLYSYDVDAGALTDLTPDSREADGADVQGVVGASADGKSVYFVALGALPVANAEGPTPTPGADNLYLHEGGPGEQGTTVFIATLEGAIAGEEREHPGDSRDWTAIPEESQAYVTPDGRYLAFTSQRELTGYDNEDQHTEQPDKEVFEYSTRSGRLECASCNPDPEQRPIGNAFIGREIAAQSEAIGPLYQPRALSEEGNRLFFSSADALVPEAANPYVKVYEYEDGTVHLISGGSSESNDIFMDASANGNDVFFATSQQLVPSDRDSATDVYDARVEGGFPSTTSSLTPCTGEGCLPPAGAPPAFPSPGSALSGAGNLTPTAGVAPARTSKPVVALTRAQKLAKALKTCRREPKRKRAACVRVAERRYGHAPKRARARRAAKGRR